MNKNEAAKDFIFIYRVNSYLSRDLASSSTEAMQCDEYFSMMNEMKDRERIHNDLAEQ